MYTCWFTSNFISCQEEYIYLNEKYKFGIVLKEVTPLEIEKAVRKLRDNHDLFNHLRQNAIKASKIFELANRS